MGFGFSRISNFSYLFEIMRLKVLLNMSLPNQAINQSRMM